jgi:hypothetical protein
MVYITTIDSPGRVLRSVAIHPEIAQIFSGQAVLAPARATIGVLGKPPYLANRLRQALVNCSMRNTKKNGFRSLFGGPLHLGKPKSHCR